MSQEHAHQLWDILTKVIEEEGAQLFDVDYPSARFPSGGVEGDSEGNLGAMSSSA
jgi:hypothetical protein